MKRLTANKVRKMTESGLIREIKHVTLEGIPAANSIKDCERDVELATRDLLQFSPDYYRVGSYFNLIIKPFVFHHISVYYYENVKGGNVRDETN